MPEGRHKGSEGRKSWERSGEWEGERKGLATIVGQGEQEEEDKVWGKRGGVMEVGNESMTEDGEK